jgi:hypothetical protein
LIDFLQKHPPPTPTHSTVVIKETVQHRSVLTESGSIAHSSLY